MQSLAWGGGGDAWRCRSTLGEEPYWGKLGVPLQKDIVWKLNSLWVTRSLGNVRDYPRIRSVQGLRSRSLARNT